MKNKPNEDKEKKLKFIQCYMDNMNNVEFDNNQCQFLYKPPTRPENSKSSDKTCKSSRKNLNFTLFKIEDSFFNSEIDPDLAKNYETIQDFFTQKDDEQNKNLCEIYEIMKEKKSFDEEILKQTEEWRIKRHEILEKNNRF